MKKILIDSGFGNEIRVAVVNNSGQIVDLEYELLEKRPIKGNIYVAKITRIEPSLQAVFIEYSADKKSGFLPLDAIHPGYYNQLSLATSSPLNPIKIKEVCFTEYTKSLYEECDKSEQDRKENTLNLEKEHEIELDASELDLVEQVIAPSVNRKDIDKVLAVGQLLLVQAVKDERGNKGATFTTYISLMGRYCVFMPAIQDRNGISKKISHSEERKRLSQIITSAIGDSVVSIVVRTSALKKDVQDIVRDYQYVARLWNKICDTAIKSNSVSFIHQEDNIIHRTVKDLLDEHVAQIIIQGADLYQETLHSVQEIAQQDVSKLKEYQDRIPLFTKYKVEQQLSALYQPIVTLPSGGYIIINPTEALIAVDVNSGKDTSEKNLADTALKTNLEAAREVARQIKLRDLSGLIVIDFIDLSNAEHKKLIEKTLKESLSSDRARIQTSNISSFGLLEMSRQRLKPSFLEYSAVMCPNCNGKGIVRDHDAHSLLILRTLETEISSGKPCDAINVYVHRDLIGYFLNHRRHDILRLEQKYQIKLEFYADHEANSDSFSIEKILNHTTCKIIAKPLLISGVYANQYSAQENGATKNSRALVSHDSITTKTQTKEVKKDKERDKDRNNKSVQKTKRESASATNTQGSRGKSSGAQEKRQVIVANGFGIDGEQEDLAHFVEEDGTSWREKTQSIKPDAMHLRPREMIAAKQNKVNAQGRKNSDIPKTKARSQKYAKNDNITTARILEEDTKLVREERKGAHETRKAETYAKLSEDSSISTKQASQSGIELHKGSARATLSEDAVASVLDVSTKSNPASLMILQSLEIRDVLSNSTSIPIYSTDAAVNTSLPEQQIQKNSAIMAEQNDDECHKENVAEDQTLEGTFVAKTSSKSKRKYRRPYKKPARNMERSGAHTE
ncbi:Ribonuclease E/G [Rickettsiales endosymbiont of Paramecium tredecaurelia]|uniref:Rne/Rng family ribonuclease n=1 Tax=Candidatus Sarmatiella mevalonica TaxID=2770581 RepID=UPI001924241E|nr:Rne/Rng family ribonuclease [Candidatus Sarmatiella mevalonica]MBL3285189.1 Ribonuclease E/G [Candidatus Sarmatiella mevalonica]